MYDGMVKPKICLASQVSLHYGLFFKLVIFFSFISEGWTFGCQKPTPIRNGKVNDTSINQVYYLPGTVLHYDCDPGYEPRGAETIHCSETGQWSSEIPYCTRTDGKDLHTSIGVPTLSIVASTASSVALILLLVVLFVLLQPKLKSFHHSRREQGVSGEPVSIVVDGVQVSLPSYEEAVYGSAGNCIQTSDSRVQIVLSEGPSTSGTELQQHEPLMQISRREDASPGHAEHCQGSGSQRSETVLVHQAASSSWASASPRRLGHKDSQDSDSSEIQSVLSLTPSEEFSDDIPLLKEA
ncbi:sushi domain-containing protein 6 isoform X2 [Protopterus annectens]|uniref:sushi domain-containing protein 6 isoform X2 n=1 Tax=Protopterus annectens TaxID=7888 RepID=UPI001CFBDDAF|nr:sushi domain-containing protein 6 isoform X2 [Protopterus annectens]